MEQQPEASSSGNSSESGQSGKWDGQSWPDQENEPKAPIQKRHWIASRTRTAGILISVWPIIMAFAGSLGSKKSMFDEGSGSGAAIWLLFMSIPLGLAIAGIGAIVGAVAQSRTQSKNGS